jgi:uncharacterized membrane protein YfcA
MLYRKPMSALTYLFWPNPANATYDNPKVVAILVFCAVLVLGSFVIRRWRSSSQNPVTRKLSKSWASASMTFGVIGAVFAVARVEQISYVSMRAWVLVWVLSLVAYLLLQARRWRKLHYEVMPQQSINDPREKYLPKRKKR